MFKKINNHHLSLLIIIVFILNTILFQTIKMSKAQWWTPPSGAPGEETSNILTSPLSADLDLGGNNIIGDGNIDINARGYFSGLGIGVNELETYQALHIKKEDSAYVGLKLENTLGSSILSIKTPANTAEAIVTFNNGSNNWQIGMDNNPTAVRGDFGIGTTNNENPQFLIQADGNVGIGTIEPNKNLHIYDTREGDFNAEINLQSIAGDGNHWAMYHDSGTDDLRFWHGGENRLIMKSDGNINTSNDLTIGGNLKMNGDICDDNGNCIEDLITTLNYLLSDLPYVWLNGFGVGQTASFTWPMGSAVTLAISVKLDNSPGESEGWQLIASDPALVVVSGTDWQVGGEGLWEAPGWVNVVEIDRMNTAEERTLTLKFISKSTNAYKYFYLTLPRYPIDQ